jgi:hypothetical protein
MADEALVLTDNDGNYYLLPTELIQLAKVDPGQQEAIASSINTEVEGFAAPAAPYKPAGVYKLPEGNQWAMYSSSVAWPYYRPGMNTPGQEAINPSGH